MSIEKLKTLKPKTSLDIQPKEVELVHGVLLPDKIFDFDEATNDLEDFVFYYPITSGTRVFPGVIKCPLVRTNIINLGCGFYEVTIQVGKRDVKSRDRRSFDDDIDRDKTQIFWICYNHKKDHYFIKKEKDGLEELYQEVADALYSEEVLTVFKKHAEIIENPPILSTEKELTTAEYLDVFSKIIEACEWLSKYYIIRFLLEEIKHDEYELIMYFFNKWISQSKINIEIIQDKFEFDWTPNELLREHKNITLNVVNDYSDIKLQWKRCYYVKPGVYKLFRSFLEFDYQEQLVTNGKYESVISLKEKMDSLFNNKGLTFVNGKNIKMISAE